MYRPLTVGDYVAAIPDSDSPNNIVTLKVVWISENYRSMEARYGGQDGVWERYIQFYSRVQHTFGGPVFEDIQRR